MPCGLLRNRGSSSSSVSSMYSSCFISSPKPTIMLVVSSNSRLPLLSRLELSELAWLDLCFLALRYSLHFLHSLFSSDGPAIAEVSSGFQSPQKWSVCFRFVAAQERKDRGSYREFGTQSRVNAMRWCVVAEASADAQHRKLCTMSSGS